MKLLHATNIDIYYRIYYFKCILIHYMITICQKICFYRFRKSMKLMFYFLESISNEIQPSIYINMFNHTSFEYIRYYSVLQWGIMTILIYLGFTVIDIIGKEFISHYYTSPYFQPSYKWRPKPLYINVDKARRLIPLNLMALPI